METKVTIRKGSLTNDRRVFLKKAGGLAIMGMFGLSFFTACDTDDEINPDNIIDTDPDDNGDDNGDENDSGINISGNTITIDLDIITELRSTGGWILIVQAQTLVVNDGSIKALTSVCTHSACDRNWQFGSNRLTCTCHGSVFNTDGSVVTGPANRPLDTFGVSQDDNIITVTK